MGAQTRSLRQDASKGHSVHEGDESAHPARGVRGNRMKTELRVKGERGSGTTHLQRVMRLKQNLTRKACLFRDARWVLAEPEFRIQRLGADQINQESEALVDGHPPTISTVGRSTRGAFTPELIAIIHSERVTELPVNASPRLVVRDVGGDERVRQVGRDGLSKFRERIFKERVLGTPQARGGYQWSAEEARGPPLVGDGRLMMSFSGSDRDKPLVGLDGSYIGEAAFEALDLF